MVDRDKLDNMLRHLHTYTRYLQDIVAQEETTFLENPTLIGGARYYLQVSIETCINIANHIIATERLRAPKDYKDVFKVLGEAGVLPDASVSTMQALAGLRNLLVHLYWEVDDQMVYEGIRTELQDFDTFAQHILGYLSTNTF